MHFSLQVNVNADSLQPYYIILGFYEIRIYKVGQYRNLREHVAEMFYQLHFRPKVRSTYLVCRYHPKDPALLAV